MLSNVKETQPQTLSLTEEHRHPFPVTQETYYMSVSSHLMLKEYIDKNMDFHLFNLFICFNNKLNYILRKANVLL